MEKRIRRAAIKFYRSLNGKVANQTVITALGKEGYDVVFYNTPEGDDMLARYGLLKYAQTVKAFTYCSSVKIVFVDESVSANEKLMALLHEVGHIKLGHVGTGSMHLFDNVVLDAEADAFALEVMNPTPPASSLVVALSVFSILVSFGVGCHLQQSIDFNGDSIVYITSAGEKYHRKDCIFTKDKDCAGIDKAQADNIFLPCLVCNP